MWRYQINNQMAGNYITFVKKKIRKVNKCYFIKMVNDILHLDNYYKATYISG